MILYAAFSKCTNFGLGICVRYVYMYVYDVNKHAGIRASHIKKYRLIKQEFFSDCVTLNAVIFVSDVT